MKTSTNLRQSRSRRTRADRFATGLGWLSVGLGLTALLAPRPLARAIGVRTDPFLLGLIGLRELISGIGTLRHRRQQRAPWLWSRVAGDALDLGLLGSALASPSSEPRRVEAAMAGVAAVAAVDLFCANRLSRPASAPMHRTPASEKFTRAITINRPAAELYGFWRDFENLPRFMSQLEAVQVTGARRSHWVAKGPANVPVEWDAEITEDTPNERIAWRSLEGADVDQSGSVEFEPAPGGRGTVVRVTMEHRPPGGRVGAAFARLFNRAPEQQVAIDLHHFQQLMETGGITTTEGQPAGRPKSTSTRYDLPVPPMPA